MSTNGQLKIIVRLIDPTGATVEHEVLQPSDIQWDFGSNLIEIKITKRHDAANIPESNHQKFDYIRCRRCGVPWDQHITDPQSQGCMNHPPPGTPDFHDSDIRAIHVNQYEGGSVPAPKL